MMLTLMQAEESEKARLSEGLVKRGRHRVLVSKVLKEAVVYDIIKAFRDRTDVQFCNKRVCTAID